ncbi:connectin [Zeugodacus cucurbitae]|uniref:Connectin n=1 Tax=Zeugodacus cucurbitae TaxID=28588 RepID=A0A0A1WJ06_ZEUCU|nr:connectin [Zeugodacus cucurbitae]XP_011186535.2 connectin [Zeugodacus cucurbitae]XP_028896860.2 connectin [Zeugodacus cucurbitae]
MWPSNCQRRILLAITLVYVACLIAPAAARSRDKEGRRRSDRLSAASSTSASSTYYASSGSVNSNYASMPSSATSSYTGPMDTTGFCVRRRDMKLMCYCTPDENHVPVLKAECWVFSDILPQNDTTWTRFFQQKRLRELKFVIQNHGRLDYIPTMVFESLKNLTSINIEYSQVDVVKSNAFANLPYLERIILTNNHIAALAQDAFANHIRLRELNLEHNQIFEIDRHAFHNLPQCERLLLNNNNISNLHDSLFVEMPHLVYLNLAHNQISVLTSDIFKGLGNLNELKLSHNNINFIGDTVFAELWILSELELDDNKIERISERALDGLNTLKTLNLRNNKLKKLDNGLLRGTPALLNINVQSNELETLTFYTFQPIMDNLVNSTSELLLSDNNFICDCRLQWLFELKNRTRYTALREALESFVCTLHDPKISNFIEPVPNHILDLLNIGSSYNGGANSAELHLGGGNNGGRKRFSKSRQNGGTQRGVGGGGNGQRLGQMQLNADDEVDVIDAAAVALTPEHSEHVLSLSKRSLAESNVLTVVASSQPEVYKDAHLTASGIPDVVATANIIGEKKKKSVLPAKLRDDYYDEGVTGVAAPHGLLLAQQVELGDGLDALKHNALYNQQTNDVIGMTNTINEHDANKPQPLGIKVCLFLLKPERLPCHDELSDPTELPLSRDLMDVRSNQAQSNMSSGGSALSTTTWVGVAAIMLRCSSRRRIG